ncbi:phosphatase PAP2 family protein [Cohnella herbarum]|uniref:Inositol phosphorylceramide synthase n=1 Tax=Cohnella herbarum TaxID=2728023 RepID=A0A7Z2VEZ1_9BACL|nr:phosphatase PAP2 family protein [Cohnella herbarum]QJD81819.1 inositol phosphorylceramide synthase [Cohnella herbarum]
MILFRSMSTVAIGSVFAVSILIAFGTGKQPFAAAWSFLKTLVVSRKYLLFFIAVIAIMILNKNELQLENWLKVPYDLTPVLSGWEGSWQAWLQTNLQSEALTAICAVFYLVMFQSVMIASVGIYTHHKNMKLYYAFCIAILINYFFAVPFYLFVPVNEVWFVHPQVRFLLPDVFPAFEQEYRSLSGLNNCFPSLHTSISVTLALLASKSGIRRWAIFAWINAIVIIFSIFYLGIHWFTDMAAGVVLALFSVFVGLKVGAWAENNSLVSLTLRTKAKLKASRPVGS